MLNIPDNLRIWGDAPNERIPLARLDYQGDLSARGIRMHLSPEYKATLIIFVVAMLNSILSL